MKNQYLMLLSLFVVALLACKYETPVTYDQWEEADFARLLQRKSYETAIRMNPNGQEQHEILGCNQLYYGYPLGSDWEELHVQMKQRIDPFIADQRYSINIQKHSLNMLRNHILKAEITAGSAQAARYYLDILLHSGNIEWRIIADALYHCRSLISNEELDAYKSEILEKLPLSTAEHETRITEYEAKSKDPDSEVGPSFIKYHMLMHQRYLDDIAYSEHLVSTML